MATPDHAGWEQVGPGGKHKHTPSKLSPVKLMQFEPMTYEDARQRLQDKYTIKQNMQRKQYEPFTPLKDIKNQNQIPLRAPGQGQSKLIISEMRFFETFYNDFYKRKTMDFTVDGLSYSSVAVYVGAADGDHITQFTQIYPNTFFILVDGRKYGKGLANGNFANVRLIHAVWTSKADIDTLLDSVGFNFNPNTPVLFISDIRARDTRLLKEDDGDASVERDHAIQQELLEALMGRTNVIAYMLKFRAPYNFKKDQSYTRVSGDLWIQPFAPGSSTELRIVSACNSKQILPSVPYKPQQIEEVMAHINTVNRIDEEYDAIGAACVVCLMRHNRGINQNTYTNNNDILRFKSTLMHYNIPVHAKQILRISSFFT